MTARIEDERAVERVLAEFTWTRDERDFEGLRRCISEDFRYVTQPPAGVPQVTLSGVEEFFGSMRAVEQVIEAVQHHHTNLIVDVEPARATARAFLLGMLVPREGGPVTKAGSKVRYELDRTADGWRLRSAFVEPVWIDHGELIVEMNEARLGH